jgi:hypothetical protein
MVIWGGDIVKTTNQKDGTTFIEVFQLPLARRGNPMKRILLSLLPLLLLQPVVGLSLLVEIPFLLP